MFGKGGGEKRDSQVRRGTDQRPGWPIQGILYTRPAAPPTWRLQRGRSSAGKTEGSRADAEPLHHISFVLSLRCNSAQHQPSGTWEGETSAWKQSQGVSTALRLLQLTSHTLKCLADCILTRSSSYPSFLVRWRAPAKEDKSLSPLSKGLLCLLGIHFCKHRVPSLPRYCVPHWDEGRGSREQSYSFHKSAFVFVKLESPNKRP